ncbi:calpastatin [Massilia eurypsychrophila]|jgi:uncharacterized protein (DUF1810 family)|uniref:Calpastatin n=1 Tax=Massilia eurypsychrophila TaxID=1485217 RepID=A0A2G8TE47_9BURK|nr:DUF1810 domain-containing protein [Massilia eurypsychrophila]PIL44264.1 calpastatin [Massilia eurypsychrophila]
MDTEFNLERFVEAQAPVYKEVVAELKAGRKTGHWMWFIFPQIAGLGASDKAHKFAIASADEAAAYLAHPVLGARLRECSALVAAIDDREIGDIFGAPDDLKFHSSMTLFAEIAPDEAVFQDCINKFFDGVPDEATLERL